MTGFVTLGGRIHCTQCDALSRRSGQRCKGPAVRGKTKCRMHGGKSTGPRTAEGRQRCADARTVHGNETRTIRKLRSEKLAELRRLEDQMARLGMLCGPRTPGRKPAG